MSDANRPRPREYALREQLGHRQPVEPLPGTGDRRGIESETDQKDERQRERHGTGRVADGAEREQRARIELRHHQRGDEGKQSDGPVGDEKGVRPATGPARVPHDDREQGGEARGVPDGQRLADHRQDPPACSTNRFDGASRRSCDPSRRRSRARGSPRTRSRRPPSFSRRPRRGASRPAVRPPHWRSGSRAGSATASTASWRGTPAGSPRSADISTSRSTWPATPPWCSGSRCCTRSSRWPGPRSWRATSW